MSAQHPFRFGVVMGQASSVSEWVAKAREAESLGFSTVLMPDTLGQTWSPFPALAALATATTTIRLGTYVLANDMRNPVMVARESATLDVLSEGRFELGLGVGRPNAGDDYRKLGMQFESGAVRVARFAESLKIISALLGGWHASASGPHYAVADADIFPSPVQQPRPPILIAGARKRLLTLAGQHADIVALAVQPNADEAAVAEAIGWLRDAAGDRFEQIILNCNLITVGEKVASWIAARYGGDISALRQSQSISVLMGSPDEMSQQLEERRARWGISYITLSEEFVDAFAPVVERLAGR
ncbi:MAG TPA: TIGR03621 family F420-dependent LLM class oxidoreductase [Roseiflexaceae bacterium]|nr:TIGR03621 family F420-dependent LLM class oxidoreductase [Roseiflexaceae bacterium]